jgi:hypothetical protein
MDVIEAQALLIRHTAAMLHVDHVDEEGRLELLYHVLIPQPALLAASVEKAERCGHDMSLARKMCGTHRSTMAGKGRKASQPSVRQPGVVWA